MHCVAKGYYTVGALDQDENTLTKICLFDSQYTDLFSWINWIAGDSRERVEIKTSQGKNGFFFRSFHFKHWTYIVSDFIIRGVSIMKEVCLLVRMISVHNAGYMTNAKIIGSISRKSTLLFQLSFKIVCNIVMIQIIMILNVLLS